MSTSGCPAQGCSDSIQRVYSLDISSSPAGAGLLSFSPFGLGKVLSEATSLTLIHSIAAGGNDTLCRISWQCNESRHPVSCWNPYLGRHKRGHWRCTELWPGAQQYLIEHKWLRIADLHAQTRNTPICCYFEHTHTHQLPTPRC